jgi:DNA-binding response OmpR family regulator
MQKSKEMERKILCIDDSETALILLEYALNEAGYQTILARTADEAIQILNTLTPDLILLDLSMPDISGYEFLEMRIRLKIEKIPIIIISAFDSRESILRTKNLGAVDFASKPIKMDQVIEKVKTYLKA